jgi:hypothetical protein
LVVDRLRLVCAGCVAGASYGAAIALVGSHAEALGSVAQASLAALWAAAVDEVEAGAAAAGLSAMLPAHTAAFALDCRRQSDPSGNMLRLRE